MRSEERIVNFGDTHADRTFDRRPADGNLRARRRQPSSRRLPAVQGALRRARPRAASRCAKTPSARPTTCSPPSGFTTSAIASCAASSATTIRPKSSRSRIARVPRTRPSHRMLGPARRWVAGAAAAGLAAGVFLGFAMDRQRTSRASIRPLSRRSVGRVASAAGCGRTISSSSKSTTRSSARARARCAPI